MGLLQDDSEDWFASAAAGELLADKIDALLLERDAARADKNFARADEIRDQLAAAGVSIEDSAGGSRWRRSV
jgi:cysteinyl-tRNA synthetase